GEETASRVERRGEEERDDEHVARRERTQEDRHEPAQEMALGAGVVDEVLRQAPCAVVVVAELLVEVVGDARGAPPADRDGVDLDEPERCYDRRRGRDRPAEPPKLRAPERKRAAE